MSKMGAIKQKRLEEHASELLEELKLNIDVMGDALDELGELERLIRHSVNRSFDLIDKVEMGS